jgi:hypothetical protein
VIYSITITVDEPILPITDLKGVLVPTPTRDKLFVCHYFSISNPDLQPKAHTPSSRRGMEVKPVLTTARYDENWTCQRNWDFHNSAPGNGCSERLRNRKNSRFAPSF